MIDGGHKPWKPCKTSMRVLSALWGSIASEWVGRTVRLFRDPAVRYGGVEVGGIRISGMSHIDAPKTVTLAASKKTKIAHRIDVLTPDRERKSDATPAQTEKPDPRRLLMSIVREFGATQMDIVNFLAERRGTDPIAVAEWDDALVVSVSKRLSSDDGAAQFRAWLDSTNSNPEEMPL